MARARVLVVDRNADHREVLRTVLECRGMEVLDAPSVEVAEETLGLRPTDLVLLDADDLAPEWRGDARRSLARQSIDPERVLMLASRRPRAADVAQATIRKPYHFAQLVRKIESLLEAAKSAA